MMKRLERASRNQKTTFYFSQSDDLSPGLDGGRRAGTFAGLLLLDVFPFERVFDHSRNGWRNILLVDNSLDIIRKLFLLRFAVVFVARFVELRLVKFWLLYGSADAFDGRRDFV